MINKWFTKRPIQDAVYIISPHMLIRSMLWRRTNGSTHEIVPQSCLASSPKCNMRRHMDDAQEAARRAPIVLHGRQCK
ncbi:hypothetical protein P389DRAFT_2148 [Cystobasidium minutum MCA 4210]|uniref:uncharacterized protein n=1 Tax=Cystobasidium minutum MCA 4210 TaxID=1397322 RepID=UPI0034CDA3FF|eukprot:jgi/Rhomi1/2148/CE2147_193